MPLDKLSHCSASIPHNITVFSLKHCSRSNPPIPPPDSNSNHAFPHTSFPNSINLYSRPLLLCLFRPREEPPSLLFRPHPIRPRPRRRPPSLAKRIRRLLHILRVPRLHILFRSPARILQLAHPAAQIAFGDCLDWVLVEFYSIWRRRVGWADV